MEIQYILPLDRRLAHEKSSRFAFSEVGQSSLYLSFCCFASWEAVCFDDEVYPFPPSDDEISRAFTGEASVGCAGASRDGASFVLCPQAVGTRFGI